MMLLDELLEIEKDDKLYTYKFEYDDVLMWPFAKFFIFQRIYDKQYNLVNPHIRSKLTKMKNITYLFQIIKNGLFFKTKNYDIVFFNSSVGCFKRNGEFFNRLVDYFADVYKNKTLLVEHSHHQNFVRPRYFNDILYHDYLKIKIRFIQRLSIKKKDDIEIDEFIGFLGKYYNNDLKTNDWKDLKKHLSSFPSRLKSTRIVYDKFFKKIKPKILLVEDASYGRMNSYIIRIAKENNIYVAEYQHGLISNTHPAYNFITNNINQKYIKTLPDAFLSFGKYWAEHVRLPFKIINIGYPHLIEEAKKSIELKKHRKTILIGSSGTDYQFINSFINSFMEEGLEYDIILRPHPAERSEINKRYSSLINKGVKIDISNNIYDTFMKVDYFITDYSTIVYEAVAFNLPTLLFDNAMSKAYTSDSLFNVCTTAQEAINIISTNDFLKIDPDVIWEREWKKNYKKFVESVL